MKDKLGFKQKNYHKRLRDKEDHYVIKESVQ
jgi:hypothetical protein